MLCPAPAPALLTVDRFKGGNGYGWAKIGVSIETTCCTDSTQEEAVSQDIIISQQLRIYFIQ